jgi:hypothetical protein
MKTCAITYDKGVIMRLLPSKGFIGGFLTATFLIGAGAVYYAQQTCDGTAALLRGAFSQSSDSANNTLLMDGQCRGRVIPNEIIERAPIFGR